MSNHLSRRGLLGGLLAAVAGFLGGKRQTRAEAKAAASSASALGPGPWTSISSYDSAGNLVSCWRCQDNASPVQCFTYVVRAAKPGRHQSKQNPPDKQRGEQTA